MAYEQTLPPGTELNDEFRIQGLLGSGGFANTYLAMDLTLGREVAIKEFFPSELAVRADSKSVSVKSKAQASQFEWARGRFVREAQTLAKFRHPSVVRVFRVFNANNTAYIVLEFVRGSNMGTWLKRLQRPPTQDEFDILLPPLLDALEVVHAAGILHRDIKPANIYIREADQMPVLLDFGAAKYSHAADKGGTTAAIVSKGYSPHEAYSTDSKLQGPWTDIYGLAATVYRGLTGSAPAESTTRILEDNCEPVSEMPALIEVYRPEFLSSIDQALAVLPKNRPQSIGQWRKEMFPDLSILRQASTSGGLLPSEPEWHPLSDGPSGTETIYSAPPEGSGSKGSGSGQQQPEADPSASAAIRARAAVQRAAVARKETSYGRRETSGISAALEPASGLTQSVRRTGLTASRPAFYAGIALLLAGAAGLAGHWMSGSGGSGGGQNASVERLAQLDAQADAERERIAELERLAAERVAAERRAEEQRRAEEAAEQKRLAEEKREAADAERQAAAQRKAEEAERQRLAEEKRKAEEAERQRLAEEKRKAEEAERQRLAEEKRKAEEAERQRLAEEKRKAEEAERQRLAEEKRKAEEAERQRLAEEKRKAEEAERQRLAEEKRKAEEAERQRLAEEKRKAEEAERQRLAEEKRKAEEAERQRLAEEQRKAEEAERQRLAEEKRKAEEAERQRLAEEQRKAEEAERQRLAEEKRKAEEAERQRLAEEKRKADEAERQRLAEEQAKEKTRQPVAIAKSETKPEVSFQVAALDPNETVPTTEKRQDYLKRMQQVLKDRQCFNGDINGDLEATQSAIDKFQSTDSTTPPKIQLASAKVQDYESWLGWFSGRKSFFCAPIEARVDPFYLPPERPASRPRTRPRPKTTRRKAVPSRRKTLPKKKTRPTRRAAPKPKYTPKKRKVKKQYKPKPKRRTVRKKKYTPKRRSSTASRSSGGSSSSSRSSLLRGSR